MLLKQIKNNKGFTLIELLVVVAIISLLSSIVFASLNSARGKARDARRLSDVNQVRTALELYYSDNGKYPDTVSAFRGNCVDFGSYSTSGASGYIPGLAPAYISVLPLDPKPISTYGCYIYKSNATDYMFLAYATVESTLLASMKRPAYPNEWDYAIYSQGGANW